MHEAAISWLLLISVVSILVTAADKWAARRGWRRVSERALLWLAALGGGAGMYLAMRLIHHKTRKAKFMWGIPIMIVVQAVILLLLFWFY